MCVSACLQADASVCVWVLGKGWVGVGLGLGARVCGCVYVGECMSLWVWVWLGVGVHTGFTDFLSPPTCFTLSFS